MTQEEFAEYLNVSKTLISKIEQGEKEPSKKFLIKFAESININPVLLSPFIFDKERGNLNQDSLEKNLIKAGDKIRDYILKNAKIKK